MSWWPLEGIPDRGRECYQPWIQCIGEGRTACAGHYGGDDTRGYDSWNKAPLAERMKSKGAARTAGFRPRRTLDWRILPLRDPFIAWSIGSFFGITIS